MSKKEVNIDWDYVGEQLKKGCSGSSIASSLGIHDNTLYLRCKKDLKVEFVTYAQQKKSEGNDILNTKQFDVAMEGNVSMLIWLGKQRLGQKEKSENEIVFKEVEVIEPNDGS